MPWFRPACPFGYDLTLELPFTTVNGRKCEATYLYHFIVLMCPNCGNTSVRDGYRNNEPCYDCGGQHERTPVPLDELDEWNKVKPIITTVEQRRARRLAEEAARPWNWSFGDLTEADFPDGFAEIDGKKMHPPSTPIEQ